MRMNFVEAAVGAKRAVNLSLDSDLLDEAKSFGTNVSAVLGRALEQELREKRHQKWRADNAEAIAFWNDELERNGLWSDGLRLF
jgi:antitoxin CcdA